MEQDMTKKARKMIEELDSRTNLYKMETQWQIENIEDELKNLKAHLTLENAAALANAVTELNRRLHTTLKFEMLLDALRRKADTED